MITTNFYATRTLARNAAKELKGKFKDMGADSGSGKRWSVSIETILEEVKPEPKTVSTDNKHVHAVSTITRDEALQVLNRPGSIIGEQTLKTPNNNPVSVYWRRNVERTRLAHNLEKTM